MGTIGNGNGTLSEFYSGKSVFITGATGFIGKVLIEKLLYSFEEIDKIYILVREKKQETPSQRVESLTSCEIYTRLKETRPNDINKIVPVLGDIAIGNLGINPDVEKELLEKVSVVIHSAATVKFTEPLKLAYNINVGGTQRVLELCQKINSLKAFIYVSTAYSNTDREVIDETVYTPRMDFENFYKLLDRPCEFSADETKHFLSKQPNTYTFTKALAEYVVTKECGSLPTIIVRPSIVTPASVEPLEGWLANWNGATGLLHATSQGYHRIMMGRSTNIADIIPVNYVTNLVIAAAARATSNSLIVYNSCSSSNNPITWGTFVNTYLSEIKQNRLSPRLNIPAFLYFTKSKVLLKVIQFLLLTIPAYVADLVNKIFGKKDRYVRMLSKIQELRSSLEYFTMFSWTWKTDNLRSLSQTLTASDQQQFPCDPASLHWQRYIANYVKGVHKYLIKSKK